MSPPSATILVVDDEKAVRRLAARILGAKGHFVLEAASVAEARRAARISPLRINLVISDVFLPDGSAREAVEAVRRHHPNARVLCVSGGTREDAGTVLDGGAAARFLPKPFDAASLRSAVEDLLSLPG